MAAMGVGQAGRSVAALPSRVRRKVEVVRRDARRRRAGTPCLAPYGNLYLGPQGEVRACCVYSQFLGNIRVQRLPEIWNGVQQAELRRRLLEGDLSFGCSFCAWELDQDLSPYARYYDVLDVRSPRPAFPTRIEFALSSACNLQCTMCSGEISSAIRIHREGRMPAPKAYGEQFFADLEAFIPHLRHASFVGGEPFLGAENYRVWELMARDGRDATVDITTNATQWSPRVERVLQTLRPALQVSVDGTTRATFEGIRQGADFDEVMANIERFLAHARSVGTPVDISHCLIPQNHHEFGDLLLYAEARGMKVHVGVVTTPADHVLERLDRPELVAVFESLRAQADRVLPELRGHNASVLVEQLDRVRGWLESGDEPEPASTIDYEQVLGLPRRAPSRAREERVGVTCDRAAAGGAVPKPELLDTLGRRLDSPHRVLDVGPNDIVLDCSPEAAEWLGVDRAALIGVNVYWVEQAMARRFGPLAPDPDGSTGHGPLGRDPGDAAAGAGGSGDLVERTFTILPEGDDGGGVGPCSEPGSAPEAGRLRTVAVAVRDRAGWIDHVLLALGTPPIEP